MSNSAVLVKPLEVVPLQPAIGAVVENVDLRRPQSEDEKQVLRDALLKHGVIFLREQAIDEDQFIALGQVFGKVPGFDDDPDKPRVGYQQSIGGAKDQAANVWHSDGCYLPVPPALTILRAVQASPFGGDTCFSSAVAAYAGLSEVMQQRIAKLRYRSSFAFIISRYPRFTDPKILEEQARRYPEVEQPVVRIHPETGAKVLYTNDSQTIDIVGLDKAESAALLRDLSDEIKRPEYQVRWKWSDGDIAVWDNRAVQHYGVPDHTGDRRMARVSVEGQAVIGA
ncbi:TauD/TfdA family dioxygenase [Novosphingobium sp. G106]|uniref:TauD/TfdA dioxygenase family protein n=1 Tax=Novosphingobium sp. G106 TaxID=2849500 RepID=UPI001C2DEE40|nr:TauD/TfdA family dioxygenase [Novosphingobium sp. G106]MBV1691533.1 TauD/TfdA family dioxygenase [Novosphingobium sp. G106]